jgi:hypothetical protein
MSGKGIRTAATLVLAAMLAGGLTIKFQPERVRYQKAGGEKVTGTLADTHPGALFDRTH